MSFSPIKSDSSKLKTTSGGQIPAVTALLISLSYLAASLSLPVALGGSETQSYIVSFAVCILGAPFMYLSAKKASRAIFLTGLWLFLCYFVGSPVLPAIVFGSVIAISAASALISASGIKGPLFLAFASVTSYVAAFILTGDVTLSLFALALLPPSLALGIATRKSSDFTTSVVLCGGGIIVSVATLIIYRMYLLYGNIGMSELTLAADTLVGNFVYYVELGLTEVNDITITPPLHREILMAAEACLNLSIGILISTALILAYIIRRTQNNLFFNYGIDRYLSPKTTLLTVSMPAAVIYVVAYLLSFASGAAGGTSIVSAIGSNLCLILAPALILKGFTALKSLSLKLGFLGIIIAGALIIFIVFSSSMPMLFALLGAFFVIIIGIDRWAKDHYGKGEQQ